MEKASWPILFAPDQLPTSMMEHSEALQNITDQFAPLIKQFRIYFFWEMLETQFGLSEGFVVAEESAAPTLDDTERSGLYSNHARLCQFGSADWPGYKTVLAALLRYTKDSQATIETRWEEAEKLLATQRRNEASELVGFDVRNDSKPFIYLAQEKSKMQNKYFNIPHTVSNIYTGRDDFTRGLRDKILVSPVDDGAHRQKRFVLYGLGGSGKTQFCLKFVQDNRDR